MRPLSQRRPDAGTLEQVWAGVDRLVERAPSLAALRAHKLQRIAAHRWRVLGRPVPDELVRAERDAAVTLTAAPIVLERVRAAVEGPIVVLKGPEAAACYPEPALRGFVDLDLLVSDVAAAERALLAAGFRRAPSPPWAARWQTDADADPFWNKQHAHPLQWPDLPLKVELHRWPNWPRWLYPPPAPADLLADLRTSVVGVDGVSALPPAQLALVLAAHAWVDAPLGRIRDLLDVSLAVAGVPRAEVEPIAERWGIGRLWRATIDAAEAVLVHDRKTLAQRLWAQNLAASRERTVLEAHLENWTSSFWTLPAHRAIRVAASNLLWDLRPAHGEPRGTKMRRIRRAIANALAPKSAHDQELGADARQLSPAKRWRVPAGPKGAPPPAESPGDDRG